MTGHRTLHLSLLLVAVAVCYGAFQARDLIRGPILTLETPVPGETLTSSLMFVEGTAENATEVLVNGRAIPTDLGGRFSEALASPRGTGMVEIEAKDRFGRKVRERLLVYGAP